MPSFQLALQALLIRQRRFQFAAQGFRIADGIEIARFRELKQRA